MYARTLSSLTLIRLGRAGLWRVNESSGLYIVQLMVLSVLLDQVAMGARFHKLAVFHTSDVVISNLELK